MATQSVFKGFNAPSDGLSFPSVDLAGKLIIKAQLDDDIRRIPIHNEEITCDELLLMMQRVFSGRLSPRDDVVLKYKDEDGDLITIADNADLTLAKQTSRVLRIVVLVNGQLKPYTHLDPDSVHNVRKELVHVRDCVNGLLDQLDGIHVSTPATVENKKDVESSPSASVVPSASEPKSTNFDSTMFDPLKSEAKRSESSPMPSSEATTSLQESQQAAPPSQAYQQQQQHAPAPSVTQAPVQQPPSQPTTVIDHYQQQQQQAPVPQQQVQAPAAASSPVTSYSALGASTQQQQQQQPQQQPQQQTGYSNPSQSYPAQERGTPVQYTQYQTPPTSAYSGYQVQQQQPAQTFAPGYSGQAYGGYTQQPPGNPNPYSRKQQPLPQRPQGGPYYGQQQQPY
ncbi:protein TFG-like [Oscarella lobularis]|uniref:protein TFG-like n=1 Tax=Oscarella lobularis TaxID=121494 RepID=UPI0033142258